MTLDIVCASNWVRNTAMFYFKLNFNIKIFKGIKNVQKIF